MTDKFPIEVLPMTMRDAVEGVSGLTGSPVEAIVGAALAELSFAYQGRFDVETLWNRGTTSATPIGVFTLTIVKSGGRKSEIFKHLSAGRMRWMTEALGRYNEAQIGYNVELEVWEQERNTEKNMKTKSPEEREQKVRNLKELDLAKPRIIPNPKNYFRSFTTAGLVDQLRTARPSVGFFSDEAGELFTGYSAGSNTSNVEFFTNITQLWDGGEIDKTTKEGGNIRIVNRRAAASFFVQKAVIGDFFRDKVLSGQGIHGRILVASVGGIDAPSLDLTSEGDTRLKSHRAKIEAFADVMYRAHSMQLPTNPDDALRLEPEVLRWANQGPTNPVAKWYNAEARNVDEDASAGVDSFLSRLMGNAHRIAAIFAAYKGESAISDESANSAVEVMRWYANERRALDFGQADSANNNQREPIEYLTKFLTMHKNKGRVTWTFRDLNQAARNPVFRDLNTDVKLKILASMVFNEALTEEIRKNNAGRETRYYTFNA